MGALHRRTFCTWPEDSEGAEAILLAMEWRRLELWTTCPRSSTFQEEGPIREKSNSTRQIWKREPPTQISQGKGTRWQRGAVSTSWWQTSTLAKPRNVFLFDGDDPAIDPATSPAASAIDSAPCLFPFRCPADCGRQGRVPGSEQGTGEHSDGGGKSGESRGNELSADRCSSPPLHQPSEANVRQTSPSSRSRRCDTRSPGMPI